MAVVAVRTYMEITQCSEYDLYRLQLSLELKMIMHSAVGDSVRLSGWSNETTSKTFSGDHDGVGDSSHQPQPQPQPLYYFGFIRLTERTRLSLSPSIMAVPSSPSVNATGGSSADSGKNNASSSTSRQIPIVCPGHTRPLAELQFCTVREEGSSELRTVLVSACHGTSERTLLDC